jgi:hypothetical protein
VGGSPFPGCETLVETGAPVTLLEAFQGALGRVGGGVGVVVRQPGSELSSTLVDAFGAWPPSFSEPVSHGMAYSNERLGFREDGVFRILDYSDFEWRVGRVGVPGLLQPAEGVPLFEPSPSETVWWSTADALLEFATVEAVAPLGTYPPLSDVSFFNLGSDGLGRAVMFTTDGITALESGALTPLGPKPTLVEWKSFLLPHPDGVWIVGPTEDGLLEVYSLVGGVLSGAYRPFGDTLMDTAGQGFASASWANGTVAIATRLLGSPFARVAVTDGVASTTTLDLQPEAGFIAPVTLATDPGNHLVVGYIDGFDPSYRLQRFGCQGTE